MENYYLNRVQATSAICALSPGSSPPKLLHGKASISIPEKTICGHNTD